MSEFNLNLQEIKVSGYHYQRWHGTPRAQPFVINPEADLNTLVAWCAGEAGCDMGCQQQVALSQESAS